MVVPNQTSPPSDRWTPGGTNYWEYYVTPPVSGDRMIVQVPKSIPEGSPTRLVMAFHGRTLDETAINFGAMTAIRNVLLDERRYIIVSPYMHGDSWGNETVQEDIAEAYAWAAAVWPILSVYAMGGSMGANSAAIAMARADVPIKAVTLFAPSISLEHVWSRGPGDPGRETLKTAFDIAEDGSDLLIKTQGFDTYREPPNSFAGKHIRVWVSPDDEVVSFTRAAGFVNSVQPFADVSLTVTTGNHGSHDAYRPAEIIAFFRAVENPKPEPPQGTKAWDGDGWVSVNAIRAWDGTTWVRVRPHVY